MTEETKKEEGEKEMDRELDENVEEGEEREEWEETEKRNKNLFSAVIILAGMLAGSLFVDAAQYLAGSGYSEKALKNEELFTMGGKTWVAFEEPKIEVRMIVPKEEPKDCLVCEQSNFQNCPKECVNEEIRKQLLVWLRRFVPTVKVERILAGSEQGAALIEKYHIKSAPAFVFSKEVEKTNFFKEEKTLFLEKDGAYLLNTGMMGLPTEEYLSTPEVKESDPKIGKADAPVKIVVFSDFQCPYCKQFFATVTKVAKEFQDKGVALVYKDLPLVFHSQAKNASLAARCAEDQGKFWEMAEDLYQTQGDWGAKQGKDPFKAKAVSLGLDKERFNQCLDSEELVGKIDEDSKEAEDFGVGGTPAFFVGKQFVPGAVTEEQLRSMIEVELNGGEAASQIDQSIIPAGEEEALPLEDVLPAEESLGTEPVENGTLGGDQQ